jgi:hypothetical protein
MPYRPNQGTPWLTPDEVRSFLRANGARGDKEIISVLDGFDFASKPLYFRTFEVHEILFQYIRNPSVENGNTVRSGNWFCIKGATQDDVAITGGGSGRRRHRFEVAGTFETLEGVAREQSVNWQWAGGGPGGGTQIYVPRSRIGLLRPLGPDE